MYCKLLIMEYAFVYLLKYNHINQIKKIQTDKRVFTVKWWWFLKRTLSASSGRRPPRSVPRWPRHSCGWSRSPTQPWQRWLTGGGGAWGGRGRPCPPCQTPSSTPSTDPSWDGPPRKPSAQHWMLPWNYFFPAQKGWWRYNLEIFAFRFVKTCFAFARWVSVKPQECISSSWKRGRLKQWRRWPLTTVMTTIVVMTKMTLWWQRSCWWQQWWPRKTSSCSQQPVMIGSPELMLHDCNHHEYSIIRHHLNAKIDHLFVPSEGGWQM